jgi:hypothetical protein
VPGIVSWRRSHPSQTDRSEGLDSGMTNARHLAISAAAVLLLVAGAGCADDGDDPGAGESPRSSATTSTPTTTAAPSTDSEAAAAAAATMIRRYFAEIDKLRQQPNSSLSTLRTVATSIEYSAQMRLLQRERKQGLQQIGDTELKHVKVQSVNLDNTDPQSGRVPIAQVDVCWNVGNVDIIDKSGSSVVSPTRPDKGWIRFAVANYHWSTDPTDGWRVASSQDLKQTACPAS